MRRTGSRLRWWEWGSSTGTRWRSCSRAAGVRSSSVPTASPAQATPTTTTSSSRWPASTTPPLPSSSTANSTTAPSSSKRPRPNSRKWPNTSIPTLAPRSPSRNSSPRLPSRRRCTVTRARWWEWLRGIRGLPARSTWRGMSRVRKRCGRAGWRKGNRRGWSIRTSWSKIWWARTPIGCSAASETGSGTTSARRRAVPSSPRSARTTWSMWAATSRSCASRTSPLLSDH